jgi:methionyl-tRNA formyltransferase
MKFGIIGNDQMVLSCIQLLREKSEAEISFVLYDVRRLSPMNPIEVFCEKGSIESKGITKLNSPDILSYIKEHNPDYILSINNFWVIKEDILEIPLKGTINFHNSVPSRYHGLNIPTWVIINGEKTHGAMWHFVEQTIDTGDIIVYDEFELSKSETGASLMVKCIKSGIRLFSLVIDQLFSGDICRVPQVGHAPYFGKKDYPANKGYIDFNCTGDEIDRLVRGLNYHPFKNTYLYAKIRNKEKELIVNSVDVQLTGKPTTPGKVVVNEDGIFGVECKNGVVYFDDVMDETFNEFEAVEIIKYLDIQKGDILESSK